ncbi:hypothetical protein [Micromonospora sp. DH14]|uniref:hypothetical protein n=1 Tax=Micromonospora sp. DH14 TaxID=3040120 RepID=UPI0024432DCA|nr:hypothetical protein [Micromonospora sp. DH14]MDG9676375.1 hypothetical protein [Micromonospora sp. DH14]
MADGEYEEVDIPPRRFQSFADRHHLEYRQTAPGITLYLGLGSTLLGFLFGVGPVQPGDRTLGFLMLGGGAVLLVASRVLHRRMRRRDEERYREYLQWKKGQGEEPTAP